MTDGKQRSRSTCFPWSTIATWLLFAIAIWASVVSILSASFGIEFHHDYFSIISGYLQSIGLTPYSEAYNHYGVVDSSIKEIILRVSSSLLAVKVFYVVIDIFTCLFVIFSFSDKRIRLTLACMSLLWFAIDPALLGIKDFSPFLGTISPPDSKLSKLAWPSELANLFTSIWIFASIKFFMFKDSIATRVKSKTRLYGLISGLLVSATWLSKFTIGGAFAIAVLLSAATVFIFYSRFRIFYQFFVWFIAGAAFLFISVVLRFQFIDSSFISSYIYQTFSIQKDFFGVGEGVGSIFSLLEVYVSILREKLLQETRIWGLVSFFVASLLVFSISNKGTTLPHKLKSVTFGIVSSVAGFSSYKELGHTLDTVQILVSFLFTINIFMALINFHHFQNQLLSISNLELNSYRKELMLGVIFVSPVAYMSLVQIAPLGDQFHIWLSSSFLACLAGLQLHFYLEYNHFCRMTILHGFLLGVIVFVLLQLNHSSKELAVMSQDNSRFVKLGPEYGLLKGMHVDTKNLQGEYLANFRPKNDTLYVTKGGDALPELFSSKEKYKSWNKCIGAPYNIVNRIHSDKNPYIHKADACLRLYRPIILDQQTKLG